MKRRLQNNHGSIFMIILLLFVMKGRNKVLGFSVSSSPIFSSSLSLLVQSKNNDKEFQQQKYSCCRRLLSKSADLDNDDDDYDNKDFKDRIKYLKEQYLSGQQPIPSPPPPEFPNNVNRPSKLGIYENDELENLLEIHGELYPQTIDNKEEQQSTDSNNIDNDGDGPIDFLPSLHELVVQTVEGITDDSSSDDDENGSSTFMFDEDRFKNLEDTEAQQQPKEFPTFFDTNKNRPNKADVFDTEELANLLELHGELYPQTIEKNKQQSEENSKSNDDPMDLIPSLHELVVQTVEGINDGDDLQQDPALSSTTTTTTTATNGSVGSSSSSPNYSWLTDDIQQKIPSVIAIASDVDGTLVGSDQTVHPKTKAAVMAAIQEVENNKGKKLQHFIPATGKTRAGALNSLGPELGQYISKCPGVFIQGLYCVSSDGTVIFEKKLPTKAIEAAEQLVAEFGTSIIAYDGDDLYTTDLTQFVMELHEIYCEPLSKEIPSIANHKPGVHKILICDNDLDKLATIRPKLEELALSNQATVTQAMPGMLELLPEGCSKALGVQKLCEELRIDPSTQLLAIGDAENDVEMLELSAIGVCVGNGCDLAKDAADIVLEETNDDGGAGIAIEVLGGL